jgi:hypothetical protein
MTMLFSVESTVALAMAVEVHEADQGRFVEGNSLPRGDFVQRVVNVRQMVGGDVADEGAHDFVVTHAAMRPAKKQNELRADRKDGCENAVPVGSHRREILLDKVLDRASGVCVPCLLPRTTSVCGIGGTPVRKRYIAQMLLATVGFGVTAALIALSVGAPDCSSQQDAGAPAIALAGSERLHSEIRSIEGLLPGLPDRGAALFLLAHHYARLGEQMKALALLKECAGLDAGFVPEPARNPSLQPLESNAEFRELLEQVRQRNRPVHRAHVAFTVPDKDLFPEGLAVDALTGVFYMGSEHLKKIVKFTLTGGVSDFVQQGAYDLSPVGGVHVDPADHSVWATTDAGAKHRPELLHFDTQGKLLERYAEPGLMPHDLNDSVLRGTREIFATDTEGNHVYRFDRAARTFTEMKLHRSVFDPNGITLSRDGNLLFIGDDLGVIRVDLRSNESTDVNPGARDTLAGIDGLYWYKGDLVGVEYGTGAYRVMRWRLSPDGRKIVSSEVLERGTDLVNNPTTGAIYEGDFYFMANTGIFNLENDKIVDESKLAPVKIAVVALK